MSPDDLIAVPILSEHARSAQFGRDINELSRIFDFLNEAFAPAEHTASTVNAMELAVEEVFVNLVKYNPQATRAITVEAAVIDGQAVVRVTDPQSSDFDLTRAGVPDVSLPLENRMPGGLGIHLVRRMMDRIDYRYREGTSTLVLQKRME